MREVVGRTRPAEKGKDKGAEEKENMEAREVSKAKGTQEAPKTRTMKGADEDEEEEEHEEVERVKMAPNMAAGGTNPKVMADPEEEEAAEEEKKGMQRLRWADCDDGEEKEAEKEKEKERESEEKARGETE